MRRSLSAQLVLSATLALIAAIALIFGAEIALSHYLPAWLTRHSLAGMSDDLVEGLRFDASGKPISIQLKPSRDQMFDALPRDVLYRVTDREGNVLLTSDGSRDALASEGARSLGADYMWSKEPALSRAMAAIVQTLAGIAV